MKIFLGLMTILSTTPSFLSVAIAQTYLPEQRPGWCRNEVANQYDTYMADIAITGNTSRQKVTWVIGSTGRAGSCQFDRNNKFVSIIGNNTYPNHKATGNFYWSADAKEYIAPDGGICHTCSPENGFPNPPKTIDRFFYLPNEMHWFDPSGVLCATCTPNNGFPVPAQ